MLSGHCIGIKFVVLGSDAASCCSTIHQRKMRGVAACGFFIILFDAVLSVARWAGLVLLKFPSCGGLAGLWAFGALKLAILHVFTSTLTEGKPQPVLHRFVALLCLLSPVFESGQILMASPSEPYVGPSTDLSMLLLGPVSSSLACVVWEKGLCGDGKIRKDANKPDARQLLIRMLKYFKPDTFYLIAAFSFLILGVICKCETLTFYSMFFKWYTHIYDSLTHRVCITAFSEKIVRVMFTNLKKMPKPTTS